MAHFAELDDNDFVTAVYVVANEELLDNGIESEEKGIQFLKNHFNNPDGKYIQTSYNKNFRGTYAGIGSLYNRVRDKFIPAKVFPSWIWDNENNNWIPPVPKPVYTEEDNFFYVWDELTLSWVKLYRN